MRLTSSRIESRTLPRLAVLPILTLGLVALTRHHSSASSPPGRRQEVLEAPPRDDQRQERIQSCPNAADSSCAPDLKRKQAQERPQHKIHGHPARDPDELWQQETKVTTSELSDRRHSHTWRYEYFDEQADGFDVRVLEDSVDERLANTIYTVVSTKVVSMDFFNFSSGNPQEDLENMNSVAGSHVDEATCERHLKAMLRLLDETNAKLALKRSNSSSSLRFGEEHLRLARLLDSYGRYESGYLSGKTHTMGQYDQCVSTHLLLKSGEDGDGARPAPPLEKVPSRYCWARMSVDKHLNDNLRQRPKRKLEATMTNLNVGICLPQSCHSKTFARNKQLMQRLIDSQFRLPRSLYIDDTLEVDFVYCLVDEGSAYSSLPFSGRLAVFFVIGWLLLTIYATYAPAGRSSWLECLSLRKSWLDFVGEPDEEMPREQLEKLQLQRRQRTVELDTLNPVKVFGCALVVLGHSALLQSSISQDALKTNWSIRHDPLVLAAVISTVSVDTFFVITGLLMGYVMMQRSHRKPVSAQPGNNHHQAVEEANRPSRGIGRSAMSFLKQWLKLAVTRHLRLVPLYFIVFWLKKSVFISYFADRPLWDAGFNKDTNFGACRHESWLTPFTMMAAFLPLSRQCTPVAWSVATDLFASIIVAPIGLIMPRNPKVAFTACLAIIGMRNFWALRAFQAVDSEMSDALCDMRAHGFAFMFGDMHHVYTYPHLRFSPVLIGLVAGYCLHYYGDRSQEAGKVRGWPRWFSGLATKWALLTIASFILVPYTPHIKRHLGSHHKALLTGVFTTGRDVWAISNAIVLMRMASDWRQSFWMKMSAGRFWRIALRLNLAILLIHSDVIIFLLCSSTSLSYFTKQNILTTLSSTYFYCIPLAIFLHVVYERPIDELVQRHILPRLFA